MPSVTAHALNTPRRSLGSFHRGIGLACRWRQGNYVRRVNQAERCEQVDLRLIVADDRSGVAEAGLVGGVLGL
jgi:hypothetical protein